MRKHRSAGREKAFALVVTLIMIVLAAVVVIGLLASSSADRSTASQYDQRFQAELAAQSGLEAAKQALLALPNPSATSQTQNDSYIVVSVSDTNNVPYYYIGSANPSSTDPAAYKTPAIQYFPLYSGGTISAPVSISAGLAPVPTPPPTPTSIASQTFSSGGTPVYYPKLFASPAPHATWQPNIRTQWQTVPPTSATSPQYRYTYWIEDLAGYVDANVAGNLDDKSTSPNGVHIRSFGYDPKEIALFTLFGSGLPADDGSTYAKTLVGDHSLLFTRLTTRLGTTSNSADDNVCLSCADGQFTARFGAERYSFWPGIRERGTNEDKSQLGDSGGNQWKNLCRRRSRPNRVTHKDQPSKLGIDSSGRFYRGDLATNPERCC